MELKINTDDGSYAFPKPRISHWKLVQKWSQDIDKWGFLIALITECPLEVANGLSFEVQGLLLSKFIEQFEDRQPSTKDFTKSTFGEFIDLDLWLSLGLEDNMSQICETIFNDPDPLFNESFNTILAAAEWRMQVYRDYDEFFGLSEYEKAIERGVEIEETQPTQQSLQLAWYETIQLVTDGNLQMSDWVVDQPYKKVLNWLTWKKNKIEQQMLDLNKRKVA
jgi:hypothetical protein